MMEVGGKETQGDWTSALLYGSTALLLKESVN